MWTTALLVLGLLAAGAGSAARVESVELARRFSCKAVESSVLGIVSGIPEDQSGAAWCLRKNNHDSFLVLWAPAGSLACEARELAWGRPIGTLSVVDVKDLPLATFISHSEALDPPSGATFTGRLIRSQGENFDTLFLCLGGQWYFDHQH